MSSITHDWLPPARRNVGYHVGFRSWSVDMEERLVPMVTETRFRPGYRIEAVCPQGKLTPCLLPCLGFGHGCGIYAVKKEEQLGLMGGGDDDPDVLGLVTARVALWGLVIEHRKGFRARYCYPLEFLDVVLRDPDDPRHARIRYFLEDAWQIPFRPSEQ